MLWADKGFRVKCHMGFTTGNSSLTLIQHLDVSAQRNSTHHKFSRQTLSLA
jgi:hypothetical protein